MSLDYKQINREFHLYPREFDVDNKSFIYIEDNIYLILKLIIPSQYLENLECFHGNIFLIF